MPCRAIEDQRRRSFKHVTAGSQGARPREKTWQRKRRRGGMISQFFVLSQRGDHIVFRDYRGEVPKGSAEIFFRKVKFWNDDEAEEAPPVFVRFC
ncbi:AP-4 complex subunit mu-like [Miscanthus floridulus]|uniref:AP-4 complex subunit mu-like n=1 Tax=Miscanthus floridulus TaxID=154761 RepID=UPI0034594D26